MNKALTTIPVATYRLQLNKDFNFGRAAECITYLHRLGISHCYVSPYLKARPGSTHGYDIVDHNAFNPELGGETDFDRFITSMHRQDMGLISDIVPNHMGVMGADNAWWLNVLENGPASPFAPFFDIDWHPVKQALDNKILLPVLGEHYGNILEKGELKLTFAPKRGEFSVYYFQHRFPIDPQTYPFIFASQDPQFLAHFQADDPVLPEFQTLENSFNKLPPRSHTGPENIEERARDKEVFKTQLARLCTDNACLPRFIERRIEYINRENSELHALLELQAYRLACWHVAGDEINYRRFFDINDLAGLRMEREDVFVACHRLILQLIEQGKIQGLRLDHADGLYDPVAYYRRLHEHTRACPPLYIIAEKIVADYEYLNRDWPIHGTTGYEFAAVVNGVFIDPTAEADLTRAYTHFSGRSQGFDDIVYRAKKHVMKTSLAGELNMLANQLSRIAEANPKTRDYTLNALREALAETVACFPVYRTYIETAYVRKEDNEYIDWAIRQAKQRSHPLDKTVFDFIRGALLLEITSPQVTESMLLSFVMRFQQYTAPVMAKGFEDTALYQYYRLASLNEVGSDPRHFSYSVDAFHHFNQDRVQKWPHGLLSLSSHDSKRSADARARINVLSETPRLWRQATGRWHRLNNSGNRRGQAVISRNDEYLFYQTLIGTWPLREPRSEDLAVYRKRLEQYMLKAVREAKLFSSWLNPNQDYERALLDFISRCLGNAENTAFIEDFRDFERKLRPAGLCNALAQTLLLLTAPGVPDIYQGNERWSFALVDPDNRRAVDFAFASNLLDKLEKAMGYDRPALLKALQLHLEDGRIKQFVVNQTLRFRMQHSALFREGDYLKIACRGDLADHLVAFARQQGPTFCLIVVPRLTLSLLEPAGRLLSAIDWGDTWLALPQHAPRHYRELFSQMSLQAETDSGSQRLNVGDILAHFPLALLSASG